MEGAMPLVTWIATPQYMTVGTKALGYPDYFAYTLMVAKILGVIAIVLPQTPNTIKEWAYAGFTFNLLFAFISHYIIDKEIGNMIMPLVVLVILFVSYVYSKKIKSKTN